MLFPKYLKIVKSLKDYYSIWYKRFMTDEEYSNYSLLINEIYAKIIDNQASGDFITISYIDCPLLTPGERTHAILMPQSNTPKKRNG